MHLLMITICLFNVLLSELLNCIRKMNGANALKAKLYSKAWTTIFIFVLHVDNTNPY